MTNKSMAHREKLLVALAGVFALSLAAAPEANAMHIMEGYLPGGFCIAWAFYVFPLCWQAFSLSEGPYRKTGRHSYCWPCPGPLSS